MLAFCSAAAHANWQYGERQDNLTGQAEAWAEIKSTESLSLSWPYSGTNFGSLNVRRSKARVTVWLEVDKGQFVCSVSGCQIEARFDERPPSRFAVQGPADYDSKILIILDGRRFVSEASSAKSTIRVRANMYQEGAPVMRFDSSVPLSLGAGVKPNKP